MEVNPYFSILSIDNSRREKKEALRNVCSDWTEVGVWAVDGKDSTDMKEAFEAHEPLLIHRYGCRSRARPVSG